MNLDHRSMKMRHCLSTTFMALYSRRLCCFAFFGPLNNIHARRRRIWHRAGYTLIVSRVSTCSCTISWTTLWNCELITIHFSQYRRFRSSLILWETWRETFPISSLTFCENTNCLARTAKCEMRKMIGEMVYKMPSIHLSFLSFCQHFFAFSSIWQ